MADPILPAGNGRESLTFSLGGRSIGVQVRDLLSVLLLAAGCVGGFLIYGGMRETQLAILSQQREFQRLQQEALAHLKALLTDTRGHVTDLMHAHEGALQGQTETLMRTVLDQRAYLSTLMQDSQTRHDAQTETIRKYLLVHELNALREPAERVPLELDPAQLQKGVPAR